MPKRHGRDGEERKEVERPDMRGASRFPVSDYELSLCRKGLLSKFGFGRKNVADRLLNLSVGGARVVLDQELPRKTAVTLRLKLPKFKDTLEVEGTLVRVQAIKGERKRFEGGVEFGELNPAQKTLIRNMEGWFTSEKFRATRKITRA